jgi:hypothetical protein
MKVIIMGGVAGGPAARRSPSTRSRRPWTCAPSPQFLEQAEKELLDQQWKKVATAKLPDGTELPATIQRIG